MARTLTPEDLETLVARLRSSVDARMRAALGRSVENRNVQIAALQREQELVADDDSAKGRKLQLRLSGIERQAQLAGVDHRTAELGSKLRKGEATVTGRVTDARGRPLAGVRVELAGEDEPGAPAIKPATTDANGFYAIRLPHRRLKQRLEKTKALKITVTGGPTNVEFTAQRPAGELAIPRRIFDVRVKKRGRIDRPPVEPIGPVGPSGRVSRRAKPAGRPSNKAKPAELESVNGIGPARLVLLRGAGIKTRQQFAKAKPAKVAEILGVSPKVAAKLVQGARRKKR